MTDQELRRRTKRLAERVLQQLDVEHQRLEEERRRPTKQMPVKKVNGGRSAH